MVSWKMEMRNGNELENGNEKWLMTNGLSWKMSLKIILVHPFFVIFLIFFQLYKYSCKYLGNVFSILPKKLKW